MHDALVWINKRSGFKLNISNKRKKMRTFGTIFFFENQDGLLIKIFKLIYVKKCDSIGQYDALR